ncbi:MAG: PKD domain-containing protein, partial [Bacteroidetes bacterium]|nr:PKD domain-containing protein [Bacteroidota bacterium]
TDLSTSGGTPIDTWHYYADNGYYMSSCFKDPSPSWNFVGSTGSQNISLVVCSTGCCDTLTVPNAITINGPLAQFKVKMHCETPFVYEFEGNIQDASSWNWDFGDGTVVNNSTASYMMHTYTATGNYEAVLIAFNNTSGCQPDTFKRMIYVRDIKAEFLSDSALCARATDNIFNASPSQDVYTFGQNGYIWLWGDGTPPTITNEAIVEHEYPTAGLFDTKLIVRDINGCRDTATRKVFSSEVIAGFNPASNYFCVPGPLGFTDVSNSDTTIISWQWAFGNGSTSVVQHPSHNYTQTGPNQFLVRLIAINELGCRDTLEKFVFPSKPNASFTPQGSTAKCSGDSINFIPAFPNHVSYAWNLGDNSTSTATSLWHTYATSGLFTVSLTVTDTIGCQGTTTLNNLVNIQDYPKAGFWSTADGLAEKCYPLIVEYTDTSQVSGSSSRIWDLGTGGAVVPNVTVGTTYHLPGTYTTSLIVSTSNQCNDTIVKTIEVGGPLANFDLSPAVICKGDEVVFRIKDTTDVFTWHWDFGDGNDTIALSPFTHQFNSHPPNGQVSVTLIYWSADSSCAKTMTKNVEIHQVIADFARNGETSPLDTAHCLGPMDIFTNNSTNGQSYHWNFGDGSPTSTAFSPSHLYQSPGTYNVSLSLSSAIGCKDTLVKQMVIHPIPVALASGGDTCLGSSVNLLSSGGSQYLWTPATGLSSPAVANPVASPSVSTHYSVAVTDVNGCKDTASAYVNIIQPPPYINFDTAIVIGQSIPINYYIEPEGDYNFSWSPSDSLSCNGCPNPFSNPQQNTQYVLTVSDKYGCFVVQSYYNIEVLPLSSIDVPSAFTPNGDGYNDKVYVRGWGIKRLIEFNIYNRWGEMVFSTNDIEIGWDGTYKGVLQNLETYAYTVVVETFVDERPLVKKGYVKLLR